MKIPFTYGGLMALVGIIASLVTYLLGYHNDSTKFETGNHIGQAVGLVSTVLFLVLAMRAARSASSDQSLSYGRGVGIGALTSTVSGAISAVYMLIYGLVINPEFHDLILENTLSKMPAEQADAAAGMMKFFTGPIWMSIMVLIMSPIIGTLISLIIAIFIKRAPQTPAVGATP